MGIISKLLERRRFKKDRINKGYSRLDTYSIDVWFLKTIVPMLEDFREEMLGFPSYMSSEEWNTIVDRMIFCFKESDEDTFSRKEEYLGLLHELYEIGTVEQLSEEEINNREKDLQDKIYEIEKYRDNMKNEALDLFKEYFWELWW